MTSVIFNPLEEFEQKYRALHAEKTNQFFDALVQRSGIDLALNRETVRQYHQCKEDSGKLQKKRNWLRFFRVLMCITILLIPLVILKMTPKIRALKEQIEHAEQKAEELMQEAERQMLPLNRLFTDRDALDLIEATVPLLDFAPLFSVEQETDMKINYDFCPEDDPEQSTVDTLAGRYNENPFLFENRRIHKMGQETYHGYKTIHWTESYYDSDGKLRTRTKSETLHATVTKPKPFYSTQVILTYCAQGGPELSFSRDATHLEQKSEREIEKIVKRGERKLQKKTEKSIGEDGDFVSMSNTDFEVLFDALDRTNEVQFRTLFTPLAQTNMVDLLLSKVGYGDDFHFIKANRTNEIRSNHSQGRALNLLPGHYRSYSYDIIKENFVGKNMEFFKAVYFDFAPIWAIPIYQERPVHSLKPLPDYNQLYAFKEYEVLANCAEHSGIVHPDTKTLAIFKSSFVASKDGVDDMCITAYSYDIEKRVECVSVYGGDGKFHSVPVEWDEYLPLEWSSELRVSTEQSAQGKPVIARHNGLCIYQS